jgi:hypothetical protein
MRIIALIASYNERRFIGPCLKHLHEQGVESYLVDNESTDGTVEIAEEFLDRGLIGIEEHPRDGVYDWRGLLQRKEELAEGFAERGEADWLIHLDPDEVRLPPLNSPTLAYAFEAADRAGYNVVNFVEFTFLPTREAPDHDHSDFARTLLTYYPFAPRHPHQMKAWKATDAVELAWSGGHEVRFPGLKMYPQSFPMKHYLFLSVPHAVEKYIERRYTSAEVESGWHGWRPRLSAADIRLPSQSQLHTSTPEATELDSSQPRDRHFLADLIAT